jgi:uncharacterized protein (DUF302 family)
MPPDDVINPQDAAAHAAGVVVKRSPRPVDETVARLCAAIEERGVKLFAVIDHSGEARANGLALRETKVVIFGSPRAGTPVMEAAPLAALDLPLRVLVWDDGRQTMLAYTAPEALAARYGLDDELAARLAAVEVLSDVAVSA